MAQMINTPKTLQPHNKVDANSAQNLEESSSTAVKQEKPASQIQADGIGQPAPTQAPQPIPAEQSAGLNPPNGARPQHQAPNIQNAVPTSASVPENVLYGIEELASGDFDIEFLPGESKEQAYTRTFALYTGIDLREIDPGLRAPLVKCLSIIGTHKPANKNELLRNEQRIIGALDLIVTHLEKRHGRDMGHMRQVYQTRRADFSANTETGNITHPLTANEIAAFNLFLESMSADDIAALANLFDQYHEHCIHDCETLIALEANTDAEQNDTGEARSDIFVNMLVNNNFDHNDAHEMLDQLKDAAQDHAETLDNIHADTKEYKKRIHLAAKELHRLLSAGKKVGGGISGRGTP
jgi:hypothetical protein